MLKPSFRFFVVPLGAVATLATLSAQNIQPRAQRDTGSTISFANRWSIAAPGIRRRSA